MHRFAFTDLAGRAATANRSGAAWHRTLLLGVVVLTSLLVQTRSVSAQDCDIPPINDTQCENNGGSVDDYKDCYRRMYDRSVIPAFRAMAACTHVKAVKEINRALEDAAAQALRTVITSLAVIDAQVNSENGAPNTCIGNLNAAEESLRQYIEAERNAPDIDAYRRATYTLASLTSFQNVLLLARDDRAKCHRPLQAIKRSLELLSRLKANHLDYCQILRQSASYDAKLGALAHWTAVDPEIKFDQYFHIELTWNSQCGYYDFSDGSTAIKYTPCATLTNEYRQTLIDMGGALGWLADNREIIAFVSGPTAGAILVAAGVIGNQAAGPIGAAIGAAVGALITGLEYLMLQRELDELEDLIDDKERELRDVVAANTITEGEFNNLMTEICTPWRATVDQRVSAMLNNLDPATHIQRINGYYTLSDKLNDWYNGLFLWATTPGPDGRRFIDELAQQDLLVQRNEFDQRIFGARTDQEIEARKVLLTDVKGKVTLLTCSNLSTSQRLTVRSRLNAGVNNFNRACRQTMSALAVQPDHPVAFADSGATSSVMCSYDGFRNGVATLEIRNGDGFSSRMTLKDSTGVPIAQLNNVTSATDFNQLGLPGFSCWSDTGQEFGTSAVSRLAQADYQLRMQDNIFGFQDGDGRDLRSSIQNLDAQLRLKEIVCARQMGIQLNISRTGEACGIPNVP